MPPPAEKESAWEDYRDRRRALVLVMIAFVPGAPLTAWGIGKLFSIAEPGGPAVLAWMIMILRFQWRFVSFPCPACGAPFFGGGFRCNVLRRNCASCGLPRWVDPPRPGGSEPPADAAAP